jgi:hypothetical protein
MVGYGDDVNLCFCWRGGLNPGGKVFQHPVSREYRIIKIDEGCRVPSAVS